MCVIKEEIQARGQTVQNNVWRRLFPQLSVPTLTMAPARINNKADKLLRGTFKDHNPIDRLWVGIPMTYLVFQEMQML
jgi:hypothetical protein